MMTKTFIRQALNNLRNKGIKSSFGSYSLINRCHQPIVQNATKSFSQSQTSASQELSQFLAQDIKEERKLSQTPSNGPGVPGFDVQPNGAELILRRTHGNENITVKLNINGSVDSDPLEYENEDESKNQEQMESRMRALPDFLVEIRKKNSTSALVFSCGFLDAQVDEAEQQDKTDLFEIQNFFMLNNNVSIESEDVSDRVYLGDGQLVDGQLYDLLMDYLDERGIGVEFAENLMEYSTYYEHTQYVKLLESIQKFVDN